MPGISYEPVNVCITSLKQFKRCLRRILPGHNHDEARLLSNRLTLFERCTKICQSYFWKMHSADHKLNKLVGLPNKHDSAASYYFNPIVHFVRKAPTFVH